jgi:serine/threonine protein kinase
VALKALKKSEMLEAFVDECGALLAAQHPLVVEILGMTFIEHQVMAVLEWCEKGTKERIQAEKEMHMLLTAFPLLCSGSLLKYLQSPQGESLLPNQLVQFAITCTEAIAFLHSRDIIHRDIAARNFLLTRSLDVKLSDFGMSKLSDYYYSFSEKPMPVRWCSPEVLERRKFSFESDRWALGVTLWEIFSLGGVPYAELQTAAVAEKVMMKQVHLRRATEMPDWAFEIIQQCKLKKERKVF